MAEIVVGNSVINRASYENNSVTYIDLNNPCNGVGVIFEVRVWAYTSMSNFTVGIFRQVSGLTYRCISSQFIGAVTSAAERVFVVELLNVKAGDFIGCYFTAGTIEADNAGSGLYISGNYSNPDDEATYLNDQIETLSLKGIGVSGVAVDDFISTSIFRNPDTQFEIGTPIEHGDSVVPVQVGEELEIKYTPFIKIIQNGNNILLKAPINFDGKVFGYWKLIRQDSTEYVFNRELEYLINENLEIRAVYTLNMFRSSVEYVVGPIGFLSTSMFRACDCEYTII